MGKHGSSRHRKSKKKDKKRNRSPSLSKKSRKSRDRERSASKSRKPSRFEPEGSKHRDYFSISKKRSPSPSGPPSKRRRSSSKRDSSTRPQSSTLTKASSFHLEEYRNFEKAARDDSEIDTKVTEKTQDLFTVDESHSLAHCVAEDFNMGRGVAVQFRNDFQRVDELLNQRQTSGGLAVLRDKQRYIYYLVTKRLSSNKPTYENLFLSLQKMRTHIVDNGVTSLAIPKIACGLDMLDWEKVKFMVEYIFQRVNISILVCLQDMNTSMSSQRHRIFCKLTNITNPISSDDNLDKTIIIYLSSEDGFVSEEMLALQEFNFIGNFKLTHKSIGKLVCFDKDCLIYGCIVKKRSKDPIDFEALKDCIEEISRENKLTHHRQFLYFQAIRFGFSESIINHQIINIFKNVVQSMEVNVYWPQTIWSQMPKNRYSLQNSRFNKSLDPHANRRKSTV